MPKGADNKFERCICNAIDRGWLWQVNGQFTSSVYKGGSMVSKRRVGMFSLASNLGNVT